MNQQEKKLDACLDATQKNHQEIQRLTQHISETRTQLNKMLDELSKTTSQLMQQMLSNR